MAMKIVFEGLPELKKLLRQMPEELTGEAAHIVKGAANGAAVDIRRAYPMGPTGNLIAGVYVTNFDEGRFSAIAVLKSSAPHSHLYEWGTKGKPRQGRGGWAKGKGSRKNGKLANRGVMPPAQQGRAMIPIVQRARRYMYTQLSELLRRAGFQVEGKAA